MRYGRRVYVLQLQYTTRRIHHPTRDRILHRRRPGPDTSQRQLAASVSVGSVTTQKRAYLTCLRLHQQNVLIYTTEVVKSSWRAGCVLFLFVTHRGGTVFIDNLEKETPLNSYLTEEAPFDLFILSKTMLAVGWSFIFWSVPYLEGWSSGSRYFIGVI